MWNKVHTHAKRKLKIHELLLSGLSMDRMDSWATPGGRKAKYVMKTNHLKTNN